MATAFEGRADANTWSDELLGKIDDCFVEYFYEGGAPCSFLFFPACPQYLNRFSGYRNDVDRILRENPDLAPPYAREYFAYAMIWQLHGYKFPMPLGTASVIEAVHVLATRFCRGVCEVSTSLPVANSLPCPPRIGYLSMRGILLGEGLSTAHGLFVSARHPSRRRPFHRAWAVRLCALFNLTIHQLIYSFRLSRGWVPASIGHMN